MSKKKHYYSTAHLFPRTSFLMGIGSVMSISGRYFRFRYCRTEVEADQKALTHDVGVIAQDIRKAMEKHREPVH